MVQSKAVASTDRNAVDAVTDQLKPLLQEGDLIIDGGNSNWNATIRREKEYATKGIRFFGSGVSGGELAHRFGPSLMPGGDPEAWESLKPIWEAIAAKVDRETGKPIERFDPSNPVTLEEGEPCTGYIGANGAGHYVKMVHDGIEYIDMQLICEAYFLMKQLLHMQPDEMSKVFAKWNEGDLDSFLIEITTDILQQRDPTDPSKFFVDVVLDTAGRRAREWTSNYALDMGIPANAMARPSSRVALGHQGRAGGGGEHLEGPEPNYDGDKAELIEAIREALYCSKICTYAQGFQLMREARNEFDWELDFGQIAGMFRGGCIIRARFLQENITDAYDADPKLANLLLNGYFHDAVHAGQAAWRKVVSLAVLNGVPVPAFASALAYFDSYRTETLPQNLLQAQRDYFAPAPTARRSAPRQEVPRRLARSRPAAAGDLNAADRRPVDAKRATVRGIDAKTLTRLATPLGRLRAALRLVRGGRGGTEARSREEAACQRSADVPTHQVRSSEERRAFFIYSPLPTSVPPCLRALRG